MLGPPGRVKQTIAGWGAVLESQAAGAQIQDPTMVEILVWALRAGHQRKVGLPGFTRELVARLWSRDVVLRGYPSLLCGTVTARTSSIALRSLALWCRLYTRSYSMTLMRPTVPSPAVPSA